MRREMEFKMENDYRDIVPGKEVEVEESYLQGGLVVYYTIVPAIAMSKNYKRQEALGVKKGVITDVRADGVAYYVTVAFDEA